MATLLTAITFPRWSRMPRIPKTKTYTLSDYLVVIREFGFIRYEPRAGVLVFEPASGYTLKLTMKVLAFMGDSTIVTSWGLSQAGVGVATGSEPEYLLEYLIKTAIPPYTKGLEQKISSCFTGCLQSLKDNSGQHEIAVSTVGQKVAVIVVIGPERFASVKKLLTENDVPYPA